MRVHVIALDDERQAPAWGGTIASPREIGNEPNMTPSTSRLSRRGTGTARHPREAALPNADAARKAPASRRQSARGRFPPDQPPTTDTPHLTHPLSQLTGGGVHPPPPPRPSCAPRAHCQRRNPIRSAAEGDAFSRAPHPSTQPAAEVAAGRVSLLFTFRGRRSARAMRRSSSAARVAEGEAALPTYDPMSAAGRREAARTRALARAVHCIPVVLLLCAFLLWLSAAYHTHLDSPLALGILPFFPISAGP
ncbi:hypothetical protein HU200_065006 [Digitaria exilis]|uniref:Uncharacterized protein n=1 Tax=Digitaria exilis TaxID=1010633 RepID=A0A835A0P7_9POAL|nr:hypothetical protein HU200_065006 [Digitaria exilis]